MRVFITSARFEVLGTRSQNLKTSVWNKSTNQDERYDFEIN